MKMDISKFFKILIGSLAEALEDGKLSLDDLPTFISHAVKELKEEKADQIRLAEV